MSTYNWNVDKPFDLAQTLLTVSRTWDSIVFLKETVERRTIIISMLRKLSEDADNLADEIEEAT